MVDGWELTRNINRKKKSDVLQAYRCPLSDKGYRRVDETDLSIIFLVFIFFWWVGSK